MDSDKELLGCVGLDAYLMIRYIRFCFRVCVFFTFWGMLVLMPVYNQVRAGRVCIHQTVVMHSHT